MNSIVLRRLLRVVSGVFAGLWLIAAAEAGAAQQQELRYQGWTSKVLYPELAEDLGYLAPLKLKRVGNTNSGPQDIQAAVTGDVDFGGAFRFNREAGRGARAHQGGHRLCGYRPGDQWGAV